MFGRLFRKATRSDWKAEIERSPLRELKELLFFQSVAQAKKGA
jgi:hypothetical protein